MWRSSAVLTCVIARILDRPRAGRRLVFLFRISQNPRERGTPKVLTDPRTSTPRDIEACRNPFCPPFERAAASSPFPRRPARGVFRFAPLRPRQSAFHASHLRRRDALSTVAGVLACGRPVPLTDTGHTYAVKRPLRRAAGAPGQKRLGPPEGYWRRISDAPSSHRSPPQHQETLQMPPGSMGRDDWHIVHRMD
jgi:hypothetical protein